MELADVPADAPGPLADEDVILLAPEHAHVEAFHRVVRWKIAGSLRGKIIAATYKGYWHYTPAYEGHVAAWVCHARSYVRSPTMHYIPLALDMPLPNADEQGHGGYVFVGGRNDRDFAKAWEALRGLHAMFVSDKLPDLHPWNGYTWRKERVPLGEYMELMRRAKLVVVPLKRHELPHGHCDVVRAMFCGVPVVVTRGASCDDYIVPGRNGMLANQGPQALRVAVNRVLGDLAAMREYCRTEGWAPHTPEAYLDAILELAERAMAAS